MNKYIFTTLSLIALPAVSHAQDLQGFFANIVIFVSETLIPFFLGVGFLFFAYNAVRYFVLGGSNQEGQEKAKALAIYGVAAFVFIIIFWGIINLFASSIGLDGRDAPESDYVTGRGSIGGSFGGGNSGGGSTNPNCAQNGCQGGIPDYNQGPGL